MPHSFSYIADERTRALVIGSMPGEASLAAGEYYAHRHNLFWRFVFEAYGEPFDLKAPPAYGIKTGLLLAHGVGLWDAAESCAREGSLDSDIRDAMPNDFAALFALPAAFGARAAFFAEPVSDVLGPAVSIAVYLLGIRRILERRGSRP